MLRYVSKEQIISLDHYTITYRRGEEVICEKHASVDHKLSLFDGGDSDLENLVPACRYCNELRGRQRELENDALSRGLTKDSPDNPV